MYSYGLEKVTLAFLFLSLFLDVASTLAGLSIGQVEVDGVTVQYVETNVLYSMLGATAFWFVKVLSTLIIGGVGALLGRRYNKNYLLIPVWMIATVNLVCWLHNISLQQCFQLIFCHVD